MPEVGPPPREAPQSLAGAPFACAIHAGGRGAAWVTVEGELDIAGATPFNETLSAALKQALLVIVDLRALRFIDSTGLQALVAADTRARERSRRLVVIRGSGQVARVFDLVGLAERLAIVDVASLRFESVPPRHDAASG